MKMNKLELGALLVLVACFLVAGRAVEHQKDLELGEEFGECLLNCIEKNADIPEELHDPKLQERCRLLCKNPDMVFDAPLEPIAIYGPDGELEFIDEFEEI